MTRPDSPLRPLLRAGWLLAMLVAVGGPWALLQSVAWTAMLVRNTRTAPTLTAALVETFDGEHPCDLCRSIQKGKTSDRDHSPRAIVAHAGKLVFFHQRVPWTLRVPTSANAQLHFVAKALPGGIEATPPPVPPPRLS